ncbi:ATP-binding protein [Streptomyces sp. NPDC004250]|uniref:ATP-binding protein n=1 Tax=Streptomyces sp. NPDC004250 TaxID=3364692 RepID=UPI0036AAF143
MATPAAVARRRILDTLHQWGVIGEVCDDVALVASELTANAETHTVHGPLQIELTLDRHHLTIAVRDDSPAQPVTRRVSEVCEHGRGLAIVLALAHGLGCESTSTHKTVWATFAVPDEQLPAVPSGLPFCPGMAWSRSFTDGLAA